MTEGAMTEQPRANSKILFVDDEREMLSTVRNYLSRAGYGVVVCENGLPFIRFSAFAGGSLFSQSSSALFGVCSGWFFR